MKTIYYYFKLNMVYNHTLLYILVGFERIDLDLL